MDKLTIRKHIVIPIIFCFCLSLVFEIGICNRRFFETMNYIGDDLTEAISYHGMEEENGYLTITDMKNNYLEIKPINRSIKNVKLDLDIVSNHPYLKYSVYAQDEANKLYYKLPSAYYYPKIEKSKYLTLHLSGKSEKLKIVFEDYEGGGKL